jgi:cytochrome b
MEMAVYARRRSVAGSIIRGIGAVIAIILILHILFALFGANPANQFVSFVASWANMLALWFANLFATGNPTMDLVLNYGLAAVVWLVVTGLLARLVSRVA